MSGFDSGVFDDGTFDDDTSVTSTGFDTGLFDEGAFDTDTDSAAPPVVAIPDLSGLRFTWSPPVGADVPALDERDHGLPFRLFRHFGLRQRGINIWKLVDGTFTIEQPYPLVSVEDARTQTVNEPATYIEVFFGGHIYTDISLEDANGLSDAGFGVIGVNFIPNIDPFDFLLDSAGDGIVASDGSELLWAST